MARCCALRRKTLRPYILRSFSRVFLPSYLLKNSLVGMAYNLPRRVVLPPA